MSEAAREILAVILMGGASLAMFALLFYLKNHDRM